MAIRTKRVLVVLFLILAVLLVFAMLRGSLRYKIMSNTEQLKAQLTEELQGSGDSVVNVSIVRPWYSLSPKSWTYIVILSSGSNPVAYLRSDRGFILSPVQTMP